MRIIPLFIFLIFFTQVLFAQPERPGNKIMADKFEEFFNAGKADSIFGQFSVEMQKALPIEKTRDFISGVYSQAGKITHKEFIKYQATYATYKTNFERGILALSISVDNNYRINGLFIKPFVEDHILKPARNSTRMQLPFKGEWTVYWGGDSKELNYHVESQSQKNAFDILITNVKGSTHQLNGQANEDYYAFGKEILAPCDGGIVLVVDGVKDNKPGEMNAFNAGGNMVIIKTINNEFLVLCHFRHQSIKVKEGQQIKAGQFLGLCGNSGNSSEPHLHFHIQNAEDMNMATGIKCFFDKLIVNGTMRLDYSPVKGDKIRPE